MITISAFLFGMFSGVCLDLWLEKISGGKIVSERYDGKELPENITTGGAGQTSNGLDPKTCQCLCASREYHLEKKLSAYREEVKRLKEENMGYFNQIMSFKPEPWEDRNKDLLRTIKVLEKRAEERKA